MQIGFFACVQYFNLRVTYLTPRLNYNNFLKFIMATAILNFRKSEFWTLGPLGLPIFHHCIVPNLVHKCWSTPKLWPKIEIQDGGRWIFENLISENGKPLGCTFSILIQNLVQKCCGLARPTLRLSRQMRRYDSFLESGGSCMSRQVQTVKSELWESLRKQHSSCY